MEKEGIGAGIKKYPKVLRKGVCGFMWKDSFGNAGISFVKMRAFWILVRHQVFQSLEHGQQEDTVNPFLFMGHKDQKGQWENTFAKDATDSITV